MLYVYRSREKQFIHINNLIAEIEIVKELLQVTQKRQ